MKKIILSTDGACSGNPGPGGWACILRYGTHVREMSGGESSTTNNRMELQAAIEGFRALKEPCSVTVRTDAQYLTNGITKWIHDWKSNDWTHKVERQGKQPVKNRDLWEELDRLQQTHEVNWQWVEGHARDADNNRCDFLAQQAARSWARKLSPQAAQPAAPRSADLPTDLAS